VAQTVRLRDRGMKVFRRELEINRRFRKKLLLPGRNHHLEGKGRDKQSKKNGLGKGLFPFTVRECRKIFSKGKMNLLFSEAMYSERAAQWKGLQRALTATGKSNTTHQRKKSISMGRGRGNSGRKGGQAARKGSFVRGGEKGGSIMVTGKVIKEK